MMSRDVSAYNKGMKQCRRAQGPDTTATAMIHWWTPKITKRKAKATESAEVGGRLGGEG